MSVTEYNTLISLAQDSEAREAMSSLFMFSNRLEASVVFTDAWIKKVLEKFPVGTETTGKIIRIVDGGYIVLLDEKLKLDAYMHQSQTTGSYNVGDKVNVTIQKLTVETGNISLTQK
jgi:ribosomal protein S1